ncbi:MAG: DNA polymerase III subunit chi, partial [Desulfobacteraceae bacterium]|nr:DNA polymerase III subunit chi [Desulfobacteraceae bacterium]
MKVYFAETTTEEQRGLLCRWAEHFCNRGQRVQIVVDSTPAAQYLDSLLWTFAQGSFVPHAIHGASPEEPPMEPVLICIGDMRVEGVTVVLCDAPVGFEFLQGFDTAVHFILRDDPEK